MPCTITREEALFYEKESNWKRFGSRKTDAQVTTMVACDLARVLRAGGTIEDTQVVTRRWVEFHDREDRKRKETP